MCHPTHSGNGDTGFEKKSHYNNNFLKMLEKDQVEK